MSAKSNSAAGLRSVPTLEQCIALHGEGELAAAERGYRALIKRASSPPAQARINLAVICQQQGRTREALGMWRALVKEHPDNSEFQLYLAATLKEAGNLEQAVDCYRRLLQQEPSLLAGHYNLGNILQQLGQHPAAIECYRRSLTLDPSLAAAHYNMGNSWRILGEQGRAIEAYERALEIQPDYPDAHNNRGNALRDRGELDAAITAYARALQLAPDYPQGHYNLGNALFELGRFEQAIPCFDRAGGPDSEARGLYCCYRTAQFAAFERRLDSLLAGPNTSPLVAALAAHHATNYCRSNPYDYCPHPLDFVYHSSIGALAEERSQLREQVMAVLQKPEIEEREQARLYRGSQSSGNLFQRKEPALQALAALVREHLQRYRERFGDADCELIRRFPGQLEFDGAWAVRMRSGGFLSAHIHETGWISGVLYLQLPPKPPGSDEGSLELGMHGDDFPRLVDDFPAITLALEVGDIVLFPSSLFHRTLPFSAEQERICVAFDLRPDPALRQP